MIWPFKRDPLVSDADLLVGAVNTLAISMFPKFVDEFAFSNAVSGMRFRRYNCRSIYRVDTSENFKFEQKTPSKARKESRRVSCAAVSHNRKTSI